MPNNTGHTPWWCLPWGPLWLAVVLTPRIAWAASPSDEAPVTVQNRQVAVFRAPFLGRTPAERAKRAELRIVELLGRGGPAVVTVKPEPQGNIVLVDGVLALGLVPDDADKLNGEPLEEATRETVVALRRVIAETKEARNRSQQLRALTRAGVATIGFVLAVALVLLLRKRAFHLLAALLERRTKNVQVAGAPVLGSQWLLTISRWLVRILTWLVLAPLTFEWVSFVLNQFPFTRPWAERIDDFLLESAKSLGIGALKASPIW